MDILQQRILEIALQIPEYVGYQQKDRRREMDRHTRRQLAQKYGELDTLLARIQKKAPLERVVALETLDQKLQRLIARLNTAPTGYAGWFDAAQIGVADIDALTQFDAALAGGAPKLQAAIERVAAALKVPEDMENALDATAELLDDLNAQFDQREQFLATGKKPSLTIGSDASPLGALEAKKVAPPELANLKLKDALTFAATDYLVTGKITYSRAGESFWAFLLQDSGARRWLRVGPGSEIAVCQEIELSAPSPAPATLSYEGRTYTRADAGQATVIVEGAGGSQRGTANYARYIADDARLWVEAFGRETRAMEGQTIGTNELRVYRR